MAQTFSGHFAVEPLGIAPPNPFMPRAVVLDVDGDGHLDIVYARRYELVVLRNDGTGRFTHRADLAQPEPGQLIDWPRDLAVADFDGDGRNDFFIADHGDEPQHLDWSRWPGGQSQIFMARPEGVLREETSLRFPQETSFTHGLAIGDITGNGAPDIYLASYGPPGTNPVPRFYINDGNGHFTSEAHRLPPLVRDRQEEFPSAVLLDVNRNGHLDLVLGGNPTSVRDRLLLNDGTGHFSLAPEDALPLRYADSRLPADDWRKSEWVTWHAQTADFDGDGWPDLVMSTLFDFTSSPEPNSNPHEETRVQLLLNNRDGTFRDATHLIPQSWPRVYDDLNEGWIAFTDPVDLNGDGWPDLVVTGSNTPSKLFYNVDGRYFVDGTELIPELDGQFAMVVPGDFTGNGATDLAILNNGWGRASTYLAFQTTPFLFDEAHRPTLTGIAPASGEAGAVVTVSGTGLGRTVRARVGSQEADFTVVSDTEVAVTVPAGSSGGPVTLTTRFGTVETSTAFEVTSAPAISAVSPATGAVGTEVLIRGLYLGGTTAVSFSGVAAAFTVRSDREVVTRVPEGAASGPLRVTGPYGEASVHFTVFAPPAQPFALAFERDVAVAPAPSAAPLLNLGAEFTMETWFRVGRPDPVGHLMGKNHPVSEDPWASYSLSFFDGRVRFAQSTGAFGSNRFVDAPTRPTAGAWTHAAGTLKDGTLRLFINGEDVGHASSAGPPHNAVVPFSIGNALHRDGWLMSPFEGTLREVRVWGRALSAEEIRGQATSSLSGSEAGLVAYWPLDEGSGRSAADRGPHGYHLSFGRSAQDEQHMPRWEATGAGTSAAGSPQGSGAVLRQNFPNPFSKTTTLTYYLPSAGEATVEVFDVLGRRVAVLSEGVHTPGEHSVTFTAPGHPSGMYYAVLTLLQQRQTVRMLLLR